MTDHDERCLLRGFPSCSPLGSQPTGREKTNWRFANLSTSSSSFSPSFFARCSMVSIHTTASKLLGRKGRLLRSHRKTPSYLRVFLERLTYGRNPSAPTSAPFHRLIDKSTPRAPFPEPNSSIVRDRLSNTFQTSPLKGEKGKDATNSSSTQKSPFHAHKIGLN
jgi:hypothetical protein